MKAFHGALGLTMALSLCHSGSAFAEQCCPVNRADRPDLHDSAAYSRSEPRITTEAWVVSIDDGILTMDVSGHRFTSKPDKATKFSADKATELGGRKNLALEDFSVGAPIKVTFLADSGKLVEVHLLREKLVETTSKRAALDKASH